MKNKQIGNTLSLLILFLLSVVVLLLSYLTTQARQEIESTVQGFIFVNFNEVRQRHIEELGMLEEDIDIL